MSIFQTIYNRIKGVRTPEWIVKLLRYVQDNILVPLLLALGDGFLRSVEMNIISASSKELSGAEKFKYVFTNVRRDFSVEKIKDSALNLIIEMALSRLKKQGII